MCLRGGVSSWSGEWELEMLIAGMVFSAVGARVWVIGESSRFPRTHGRVGRRRHGETCCWWQSIPGTRSSDTGNIGVLHI